MLRVTTYGGPSAGSADTAASAQPLVVVVFGVPGEQRLTLWQAPAGEAELGRPRASLGGVPRHEVDGPRQHGAIEKHAPNLVGVDSLDVGRCKSVRGEEADDAGIHAASFTLT